MRGNCSPGKVGYLMNSLVIECPHPVVKGDAEGFALVSLTGLSFWGGVDPHTGIVLDQSHDLRGQCMTGKVLCVPRGRGSCSSSGTMLEMIRVKTAPAAIISVEVEPILSLGSVIGGELYGKSIPIYSVSQEEYELLRDGALIEIHNDIIRIDN